MSEEVEFTAQLINVHVPSGGANSLAEQIALYFDSIKEPAVNYVRAFMREDTGAEKASVAAVVDLGFGGLEPSITVASPLIQAAVDETGAVWTDKWPPYGPDSGLYEWVMRHLEDDPNKAKGVAFVVARAIHARGLPAPDDYLHRPFKTAFEEMMPGVELGIHDAVNEAAILINGGGNAPS